VDLVAECCTSDRLAPLVIDAPSTQQNPSLQRLDRVETEKPRGSFEPDKRAPPDREKKASNPRNSLAVAAE
jgi:hypothetical protein